MVARQIARGRTPARVAQAVIDRCAARRRAACVRRVLRCVLWADRR
ncbi:hypothetical protein trd_A0595 (plasmid) [Thermomicrobium roseum DSM 5159]|uniref:Uncharacterized protein n=1 Tax=Thermomicrobium roseum (strain ATCC 27502 / DSM 5159 / P-2) TaxID=309801 RepID=B9L481_THERP|nr:hypothetical protein trd_A0595 [Thermomicrobium roseum DSM 5159]